MWKVQLFKLNYDNKEIEAVTEVLESAWITMGQKTRDFETGFSSFLGHDSKCLAVSNGTAALHLALLALDIKAGDEVITPGLTFIADQNVVTMVGATNVLSDITSRDDWSMDPADIERKITDKTNMSAAETSINAWRELKIPVDTKIAEKEKYWNDMVYKLFDEFNRRMEKNINEYLNMYVMNNYSIKEYQE